MFALPHTIFGRYQYPSQITITLTTRCNLNCFICGYRDQFRGDDISFDNLYHLKKAIQHAKTINLSGFGEALVYPRFEDALNYIYSLNPSQELIHITTNGTRLSERVATLLTGHLKSLTISLNAATKETYNREMKYGDFEQTTAAIQSFMSALNQTDRKKIKLHFTAHTRNFLEIPDFVLLAEKLGVTSISIGHFLATSADSHQYCLSNMKDEYNETVLHANDLARERNIIFHFRQFYKEKERPVRECLSPYFECLIQVNGDVVPCCFSGGHIMGNVLEDDFEDIWFGIAYQKLRKERHLSGCRDCLPFIPLDKDSAHFTSRLKLSKELNDRNGH